MSPLAVSLQVAVLATLAVVALGLPCALGLLRLRPRLARLAEALLLAPLVVPPSVVGLALLWLLGAHGPLAGLGLLFTRGAAVVAAAVVSFPLFLRSARVALQAVPARQLQLARILGDSPLRAILRVQLPLARRGLVGGAALAFGRAMGEFGATLMVAGNLPGRTQTLALAVYDRYNATDDAGAWQSAAILCAAALVVLLAVALLEERPEPSRG